MTGELNWITAGFGAAIFAVGGIQLARAARSGVEDDRYAYDWIVYLGGLGVVLLSLACGALIVALKSQAGLI